MNGGSHTNFNGNSFGAAGFGAATMLSGALVSGMLDGARHMRAAAERDFLTWNMSQLRKGIVLSEVRRGHELEAHARTVGERDALREEVLELKRKLIETRAEARALR